MHVIGEGFVWFSLRSGTGRITSTGRAVQCFVLIPCINTTLLAFVIAVFACLILVQCIVCYRTERRSEGEGELDSESRPTLPGTRTIPDAGTDGSRPGGTETEQIGFLTQPNVPPM